MPMAKQFNNQQVDKLQTQKTRERTDALGRQSNHVSNNTAMAKESNAILWKSASVENGEAGETSK